MCGRFTLSLPPELLESIFGVKAPAHLVPRYNIAPTQPALIVRQQPDGQRELAPVRWGLIPSWAKDPSIGNRLINARSESVTEKPSFRSAFKRRRCIVPASGFYEWQHFSDGRKQPYYIHAVNGSPLGFAGLWEHWQAPDGSAIESCTILTTSANATMAAIHDRMPVILLPGSYLDWLGAETSSSTLHKLCSPCPDYLLEMYPVSTMANSPRNDSPQCIERVTT